MAAEAPLFHSLTFTLVADKKPRASFRMKAQEQMYELHVEKGSASNPIMQFTRSVPTEVAQRLASALQGLGVFSWDESYGDTAAPGSLRWNLCIVFKEGVFSITSKGGSDTPLGFAEMLEELHRLDFPRPDDEVSARKTAMPLSSAGLGAQDASMPPGFDGMRGLGGLSAGDLGAYGAAGGVEGVLGALGSHGFGFPEGEADLAGLEEAFSNGGHDAESIENLLEEMRKDPLSVQQGIKDAFKHMSREEQEKTLDKLAATGIAPRDWWKRLLLGE